jgi:membrane associated rhomboid family serine protease
VEDHLGQAGDRHSGRVWRKWPICTIAVLGITTLLTVLQFPFPGVRLALWRDPDQIHAGQWWRLFTALFVQYDRVWQIITVLVLVAAIGVFAERLFGHLNWLLIYLGCGVIGQAFGLLWLPHTSDAGCSVAGAGLLGAVCAWLLSPAAPLLARVWFWAVVWLVAGLVLTEMRDMHGPPLLIGCSLGALLLWRNRRRALAPRNHPSSEGGIE